MSFPSEATRVRASGWITSEPWLERACDTDCAGVLPLERVGLGPHPHVLRRFERPWAVKFARILENAAERGWDARPWERVRADGGAVCVH